MNLALLKYNAGNYRSVLFALERLGVRASVTDDPEELRKADKVIFPGVGEASTTMAYLKESSLADLIPQLKQPVLGICLGQQLLCSFSEENDTKCLSIFDVEVKQFKGNLKVPHVGWNSLGETKGALFRGINAGAYVYYVHSYYAELSPFTSAISEYGRKFSASLVKDNFFAVQFHPEKSAQVGEKILENFIKL